MNICRVASIVLALWMAAVTAAQAQGLRYLGSDAGTPIGRVELTPGQLTEIRVGDEIPGWGRVTNISETHLVVERRLSPAEQDRLRSQGAAVYSVLELHIPRADLGGQTLAP